MADVYTPPPHYGEISFFELVPLMLRFLNLVTVKFLLKTISYPFSTTHFTLRRVLWRTFVQTICPNSTFRQMQWILPNTGSMYLKFMRALPDKPEIVQENLDVKGASLHWIGPKYNKRVMIFVHGGGFVMPAVDAHFYMVDWWRKEAKRRFDIDFSIAVLEYSLVTQAPWPTQLRQVAAALDHVLKQGYDPSNITVVGDSVGGHEVTFLLGHLIHPHPDATPIKLEKPLAGTAMLSPWLNYSIEAPSWERNADGDVMPLPALLEWAGVFQKSRTRADDGYYFEPATAPAVWWAGIENVVKDVLFTTGDAEGMFDDIVLTKKKMGEVAGKQMKLECFVQEKAAHNEALVEFACGDGPGPTNERMMAWINNVYA